MRARAWMQQAWRWAKAFLRGNWIGAVVILAATLIFFGPVVSRISSYSEGGDAMFNAWTLARDQHCMQGHNCPNFTDGNIYFPHKDSLLYSETQLSAAAVTIPLHLLNDNPIFAFNVLTIVSFFLSGWFMYLLAKRLSKGNELFAVLTGLVFEFAPMRLAGVSHLQNLCVFCLPLIVLLVLKFLERPRRRELALLFVVLVYLFFASWYQMVFGLVGLGALLIGLGVWKFAPWRQIARIAVVAAVAALMTLPLALQYTRFSKANSASFSIGEQVAYSSSVADYAIPNSSTVLGKLYAQVFPHAQVNAYNRDSVSYHGFILYAVAIAVCVIAFRLRKKSTALRKQYRLVAACAGVAVVGFIMSLGPLLKVGGGFSYAQVDQYNLVFPLPYIVVDLLLPQLSFIRSIGRASILVLLVLCIALALAPVYLDKLRLARRRKQVAVAAIVLLLFVELFPLHRVYMNPLPSSYHLNNIPAVYSYIKTHDEVDNIITIYSDVDYPGAPLPTARVETVLWAGYHNKNIFNGYSGYEPPSYLRDMQDFVDFKPDDVPKMQKLGLRYVLVDKRLSTANPALAAQVQSVLSNPVYQDGRHALFRLPFKTY